MPTLITLNIIKRLISIKPSRWISIGTRTHHIPTLCVPRHREGWVVPEGIFGLVFDHLTSIQVGYSGATFTLVRVGQVVPRVRLEVEVEGVQLLLVWNREDTGIRNIRLEIGRIEPHGDRMGLVTFQECIGFEGHVGGEFTGEFPVFIGIVVSGTGPNWCGSRDLIGKCWVNLAST